MMYNFKKTFSLILMFLMTSLVVNAAGNYPFDLVVRNATGSTYDVATVTAKNVLQTIPVVIMGSNYAETTKITLSAGIATTVVPLVGRTSIDVSVGTPGSTVWVATNATASAGDLGTPVSSTKEFNYGDTIGVTIVSSTTTVISIIQRR